MPLHMLAPKVAKLHRRTPALFDLLRGMSPRQTVERMNLVVRLAGGEMKQERSDGVAIRAREPVEVLLRQRLKPRQHHPAHPIELRNENTNLGTKSLSRA